MSDISFILLEIAEPINETPMVIYALRGCIFSSIFPYGVELVTTPNSVVGELCPLVRPYTQLSITTAVMSKFLIPCGEMCSAPIPRKPAFPLFRTSTSTSLRSTPSSFSACSSASSTLRALLITVFIIFHLLGCPIWIRWGGLTWLLRVLEPGE